MTLYKYFSMIEKKNLKKAIIYLVTAAATALGILFGFSSCEVIRTITTSSECHQRGDTSVVITTKTIESYNGKKTLY